MTDSESDAKAFGWAVRVNGSCLDIEQDCGPTLEPYRVCCPGGSFCPNAYNVACCPSESNCTEALQAQPHCANSTWDLYINGGYFCCEPGTTGYARDGGSNGCASPGVALTTDDTRLEIISSGTVSATHAPTGPSTTSTSSTATDRTATQTQTSEANDNSSGSNTGAIAGGVVGGVAGAALIAALLWLLFRARRRQQPQAQGMVPISEHVRKELPAETPLAEMDAQRFVELGGDHRMVAELPGHYSR